MKTHSLARVLAGLALFFALFVNAAEAATERGLIWRVEGDGATSYLVGSVHLGRPDMYPLPTTFDNAIQATDTLVLEADIRDTQQASALVAEHGFYRGERTLADVLPGKDWQKVADAAESLGIPQAFLERQRPWMAWTTLTMAVLHHEGWTERLGIEAKLLERAADRPLLELESVAGQLELLSGIEPALQRQLLVKTVEEMEHMPESMDAMIAAWKAGELKRFHDSMLEHWQASLEPIRELILDRRNDTMTERIIELLGDGRSHLIVVGGGHMGGKTGIVGQLREAGFDVTQL